MTSRTGTETNVQYTNAMEEASIGGSGYLVLGRGFRVTDGLGNGRHGMTRMNRTFNLVGSVSVRDSDPL